MSAFSPPPTVSPPTEDSFSYVVPPLPAIEYGERSEIARAAYALHQSRILYRGTCPAVSSLSASVV